MTKRTDCHRPGAIIPADYEYVFSYNGATSAGGWPIPAYGVNCEIDGRTWDLDAHGNRTACHNGTHTETRECCCVGILSSGKEVFGNTCKCGVCGANFVYGDVWKHIPTGAYIHLGHTCAEKYELLADRSAFELGLNRRKEAAAREVQKKLNTEERVAFLLAHPGLEEDLKVDHNIIRDIAAKFQQFRTLSDKQIALVAKIAAESRKPPEEKEKNVPAPVVEKRITFRGTVVSAKVQESVYGDAYKMTVKVSTPEGVWLAWGTAPTGLLEQIPASGGGRLANLRGVEIEVTAGLKPGRDAHFALLVRPNAKVVKLTPELEAEKANLIAAGIWKA